MNAPESRTTNGPTTSPPHHLTTSAPFLHKLVNLSRPHHLLELVGKAVQASHGAIALISCDGDIQEHVTFGLEEETALELRRSPWSSELIRFLLQQAVPIQVSDFGRDLPLLGAPRAAVEHPPLAVGPFLGLPLICHGRCRGALYLARLPGESAFANQDVETVLPVRTWFEQGNLFEEARLLAQLRLLNQVAQAAAGSLDLPRILSVALRELDRHMPQYTCSVWLLENDNRAQTTKDEGQSPKHALTGESSLVLTTCGAVPNERAAKLGLLPGLRLQLQQTRFAPCLRDGQAQYVDLGRPAGEVVRSCGGGVVKDQHDPTTSPPHHLTTSPDAVLSPFELQLRERGASSSFAVPLRAGDQAIGILHSICTRASGFTNEQIQLLYLVADLLGPTISNCQLVRRLRAAYEELRTTQNQLIQAEKMRALGELAGGMAHHFNNSLCGVLGFLELAIADKDLDPTIGSYLESARTCTLDAAQTVRRVQNFARWQRHDLSTQVLDFNDLVRQTMELTRHKWESLAHARGTPIAVDVQTEATQWVSGSPAELREVLTNLVFNAVDAMPQGGQLSVRTWSTPADLYLSVRDTGVGISESTRRRLFEPFFTTKGERGNGLGLSVTFAIIQRYGGEITVQSELGHGSTFTVRLPLTARRRQDADGSEKHNGDPGTGKAAVATPGELSQALPLKFYPFLPSPTSSPPAQSPGCPSCDTRNPVPPYRSPKLQSLRILVIEDEESIRRFLTQALTQLGHSARTTATANEGLTAFAEERFDLVLTDLGLPGVSGEEVARTVARTSPGTPVILLTGWSSQLKDEAQPLAGVTRILGKPITLNALSSTLLAVCQQ